MTLPTLNVKTEPFQFSFYQQNHHPIYSASILASEDLRFRVTWTELGHPFSLDLNQGELEHLLETAMLNVDGEPISGSPRLPIEPLTSPFAFISKTDKSGIVYHVEPMELYALVSWVSTCATIMHHRFSFEYITETIRDGQAEFVQFKRL